MFKRMCLIKAGFLLVMLIMLLWMPSLLAMEDPTRPPTARATSSYVPAKKRQGPRWVLNSTLISSDRRTAVINDRVVAQGDQINGATVVSIQPSAVRLRDNGREVTLVMLKKNIKSLSRVVLSSQGN